jgi:hypothetical protein
MLALSLPRNFDRTLCYQSHCAIVLWLHMYACMDVLMLEHLLLLFQWILTILLLASDVL